MTNTSGLRPAVLVDDFELEPPAPFRLDLTAWLLKRRPDSRLDWWDGTTYRRAISLAGQPVVLVVTQPGPAEAPRLQIRVLAQQPPGYDRDPAISSLTRLLGLGVDLSDFYAAATADELLAPLVDRFRGARPPRYPTLFECLTNAIACQQVTLVFGLQVLSRFTETYGDAILTPDGPIHVFPVPERALVASLDDLRQIGFSRQKARALLELAELTATNQISLETLAPLDDEAAIAQLIALRGVGRWTAEYALLRGLGRLHVFPGDDVGARNNLQRWLGGDKLDYQGVRDTLAGWHRYAGLLYFHMLLFGLERRGLIG